MTLKKDLTDRSRPCIICNKNFTPKYSDGPKKSKYKVCSPECKSILLKRQKTKYGQGFINQVISLRKNDYTINDIVKITSISKSTVKQILKDNNIFLDKSTINRHAFQGKLNKNPNCMEDMRKTKTAEIYKKQSETITKTFRDPKYSEIFSQNSKKNWENLKKDPIRYSDYISKRNKNLSELKLGMSTDQYNQILKQIKQDIENNIDSFRNLCTKYNVAYSTVLKRFHRKGWHKLIQDQSSSGQKEVELYIRSVYPGTVFKDDRTALKKKQLDIYIPDKKLGIEYDGLYWHSLLRQTKRNKHVEKKQLCIDKGIKLLAIYEDEWFNPNKQILIKKMIDNRLGVNKPVRLHTRKLILKKLDKNKEFDWFFNKFHLSGHVKSKYAYGLFLDDKLVFCVSFRTSFSTKLLEIARLASDYDYFIPNGLGKILKQINQPIVTYSDNRLSDGNIYQQNGFQEHTLTQQPSYFYTDFKTRIWRFRCRKNNNPEISGLYDTEEKQAAAGIFSKKIFGDNRPLYRIEDYGHRRWIWNPKSKDTK
jgi:Helix-turn-helix domain of resolvase